MTLSANILGLLIIAFLCRVQALPLVRETREEPPVSALCEPQCQSGYECNSTTGLCEPIECEECNNAPTEPICAYDSKTYINACELRRSNCLNNRSTEVKHNGTCRSCAELDEKMREINDIDDRIKKKTLKDLCDNSEATIMDVMSYYYNPACSEDDNKIFLPRQYNKLCRRYWCVTADGDPVTGILSKSSNLDCSGKQQCEIDGVLYNDGEIILREGCGFSKCIDGDVQVVSDYCPNEDGLLSDDQLMSLRYDLLHLFHYQLQVQDPEAMIDLTVIRNNIPAMSNTSINTSIQWKFRHYDISGDTVLHEFELKNLYHEIYDLLLTDSYRTTLISNLDLNGSQSVSQQEWQTFFFSFEIGSTLGSTSTSGSGISLIQGK